MADVSNRFQNGSVTNPITGVGRVVVNATLDTITRPAEWQSLPDPALRSIQRYEPVFVTGSMARGVSFIKLGAGTDNGLRVRSHVEDWMIDDEATRKAPKLRFIGFADGSVGAEQGCLDLAVRVGGLATIINTGDENIEVGDFLCYEVPKKEGEDRSFGRCGKRLLLVKRLSLDENDMSPMAYANKVSRVFGRAMSKAKPGKELDVLLGGYMI